ncbi:MAG: helix-turn-helix domain-containing protein [Clostridia bacterium]|nr:helix-turn-helix domain-containing protein [Clostridia bacterium]
MYTALIAEDELLVRMGIASSVPWEEYNIRLVGVAENGIQALQLYREHHPDIVITDVRMPQLSGLELIQAIRSESLSCFVIIVTNVDDDRTINIARMFGVSDILFKASMKQTDIMLAVKRACDELANKDSAHTKDMSEHEMWAAFLIKRERAQEIPYGVFGFASFVIRPAGNAPRHLGQEFEDALRERIGSSEQCVSVSEGNRVYLIFKTPVQEQEGEALIRDAIGRFRLSHSVCVSAACAFATLEIAQLKRLMEKIERIGLESPFYEGSVLILSSDGEYVHGRLAELKRTLARFALSGRKVRGLQTCVTALNEYPGRLTDGGEAVVERGRALLSLIGDDGNHATFDRQVEAVCSALENYLEKLKKKIRPEILRVVNYLEENLSGELPLAEVAEKLGFNASYFSRLFKREMGCTYSEYLTELRIQRAKMLLLETKMSVQAISEECGFSEISYFSYRFKLMTGITPMQWRNQQ